MKTAPAFVPTAAAHAHDARDARLPGPRPRFFGIPLLRAMRRDYLGVAVDLQRRFGDLVETRITWERVVDVFAPEAVREVLVDQADKLVRWERGIEVFAESLGRGVIVAEGADWRRQRRMLHPAFTPRRVAQQAGLMTAAIDAGLSAALPGQAGAKAEVDMAALWSGVAMDVILRTLFSASAPGDTHAAADAIQALSQIAMREMFWPRTLPDWLPLPGKRTKRRALRTLRTLVGGHIRARRRLLAAGAAAPDDDLLAALLELRDEEAAAGAPDALTDAEIFDQCMGLFQAGHETSATALLWWCHRMAAHPTAAAQARAEVDAVLGGRVPTPADVAALPWLAATLKETLRLHPPIAGLLTRRATADLVVQGRRIPRGAMIRVTPWMLHHDPRSFAEPATFRPARFLPGAPPPPRGAWLPFGTGPRVCIGQHFAMLEMTLAAARLLQRWTLRPVPGAAPPVPEMNVTLRPRGGLRLVVTRRMG